MFSLTAKDTSVTIHVKDRFDFVKHGEFKEALTQAVNSDKPTILIDLSKATYLDSSALGMLLLAKDKANQVKKVVVLVRSKSSVKEVLTIANFGKLFNILD